ncbi:hypothetical protein ACHAXS_013178, partial [Conticribra weissflogii]
PAFFASPASAISSQAEPEPQPQLSQPQPQPQPQPTPSYNNLTLQSPVMSAKVFMPLDGTAPDQPQYYTGSRFEHGSMIGDITFGSRSVYGRGLWRASPAHDPSWPESGVGLASEFGCGDNGVNCVGKGDITNGVLGYEAAGIGEPFLKIGVGALIKGSCPECAGSEEYRFNSPYEFYRPPKWDVLPSPGPNEITFVSEEVLGDYGYRIQKTARLDGNVLTVRSLLTNLGKKQFTTPWYSHHFFTGDDEPVGPGYVLDLGLSEFGLKSLTPLFRQPGLGTWSADITDYSNVTMARDASISIAVKKILPEGVKLKAEFLDENTVTLTDGSFTLHAPNGISVFEKIPELQTQSRNPFIYAYNVYAERGTLSPEPMLLLYLQPGETTFWTQHLKFSSSDKYSAGSSSFFSFIFMTRAWQNSSLSPSWSGIFMMALCSAAIMALYTLSTGGRRHLRGNNYLSYSPIPDHSLEDEPPRRSVQDV